MSRYKAAGTNAVDEKGTLDITEFINVSKDDALAFPVVVHRTYPSSVVARMDSTIRPFVEKSVEVNNTLINALNAKLGLPGGTLGRLHKPEEKSRCVARVIRAPPKLGPIDEEKALLSAHTDFGSLVCLCIVCVIAPHQCAHSHSCTIASVASRFSHLVRTSGNMSRSVIMHSPFVWLC